MLQFGPLPQQTMSGGLGGGVWLAGLAGGGAKGFSVVCWAVAETKADRNRRSARQRVSMSDIRISRSSNGLSKVARRQLVICHQAWQPIQNSFDSSLGCKSSVR